jgi:hypothetical protein
MKRFLTSRLKKSSLGEAASASPFSRDYVNAQSSSGLSVSNLWESARSKLGLDPDWKWAAHVAVAILGSYCVVGMKMPLINRTLFNSLC